MEYSVKKKNNNNPNVWGPGYWFLLHVGSLNYPSSASPIVAKKMENYIIGIPSIIPCFDCKCHAISYIESQIPNLSKICEGRDSLFKFYVDFHNSVNERLGKTVITLEDAYKLYK